MFGLFRRVWNFLVGWTGLRIKSLEEKHPEIAFENAINSMTEKYSKLKSAAAGLIKRRDKINAELELARNKLLAVRADLETALSSGNDEAALILIEREQDLDEREAELASQQGQAATEAEAAKGSLRAIKVEVDRLKTERDRVLADIQNAEARKTIQDQLEGLSVDDDLKALENVREHAENLKAQVQIGDELDSSSLDTKLAKVRAQTGRSKALDRLEKMKVERGLGKEAVTATSTERNL